MTRTIELRNTCYYNRLENESDPADALFAELLAAHARLQTAERAIVHRQASLLAWLHHGGKARILGFARVHGAAELLLGLAPRTTTERLTLWSIFRREQGAEQAFLAGRLTACQILALAPVLGSPEADRWLDHAVGVPVRELQRMVADDLRRNHAHASPPESGPAPEDDQTEVSFPAPLGFLPVWDEAMEATRRVLGYQASQGACLDAILAEAGLPGAMEPDVTLPASPDGSATTHPSPSSPPDAVPIAPALLAEAIDLLAEIRAHRVEIDELLRSGDPHDPFDAIDHLLALRSLQTPIDLLQARLLRVIRRTRTPQRLGFADLDSLLTLRMGISARTARRRIARADLFDEAPDLALAYARGGISLAHLHLLGRLGTPRTRGAWIARARQLTVRQLSREVRFHHLLARADRLLAARFAGPMPCAGLERELLDRLARRGWSRRRVNRFLRESGRIQPAHGTSRDPAHNRLWMDRLEGLLEILLLSEWDSPARQDLTAPDRERPTFAHLPCHVRVRFRASTRTLADFHAAIGAIRRRGARNWPTWAIVTAILARAVPPLRLEDPMRRPRHRRIFRRDGYRCQAPGCWARQGLEAHHIRFRSRGGGEEATNRTTLCHADHHHVIHAGHARLRGRAPEDLRWELGLRPGRPPLLTLSGERIEAVGDGETDAT